MGGRRSKQRILTPVLFTIGIALMKLKDFWQMDPEAISFKEEDSLGEKVLHHNSRHLLATQPNCTPAAIENFPNPLMSPDHRKEGGVLVHILVAAYMFWGLAIVCDEYFVPACEKICDVLGLESDVAGATFMAGGSSAPELATAVVGVFVAEDDIALGAVVGSAFFNILFVIAFCALFAGTVLYLNWWPLLRDCVFYAISILALVVTIYDGEVRWYEALCLIALYVLYCSFMVVNKRIEQFIVPKFTCCGYKSATSSNVEDAENIPVITDQKTGTYTDLVSGDASEKIPRGKTHLDEKEAEEDLLSIPEGCLKRVMWVVSLPLAVSMYFTIPDIRKPRWAKCVIVTFIMSIVWIGVFSYIMVWMIAIIGHTLGIPDTVMGLTFMAAGSSVPDVFSSYLVLKDGLGDMAVSNAIGSNIFDILICIGIPYLIRSFSAGTVEVYSHGLTYSSIGLFSTVILLPISMQINGWKLDVKYGVILMLFYLVFLTIAILFELNIFGDFRPPTCPSDF